MYIITNNDRIYCDFDCAADFASRFGGDFLLPLSDFDPYAFVRGLGKDFTHNYKVTGVFPTHNDDHEDCPIRVVVEKVRRVPGGVTFDHSDFKSEALPCGALDKQVARTWEDFPSLYYGAVDKYERRQEPLGYISMQLFCKQFSKPGMLAAKGDRYIAIGCKDGVVFKGTLREFLKSRSRYIADVRETAKIERISPNNGNDLICSNDPIVMWIK